MKRFLMIVVMALLAVNIKAQNAGGSLIIGFPQKEFNKNVNSSFLGGVEGFITISTPTVNDPFTIGLNASYSIYGIETRRVPLSSTIADVKVDVERKNSMANLHLFFQVSPFDGPVKPYLEGLVGGSYLFTETSVEGSSNINSFASTVNHDDFAWSYGAGVGLQIALMEGDENIPGGISLDIKTRFMFGSEAEYLTTGDLKVKNNQLYYNTNKSSIDYMSIQIGLTTRI